MYNEGMIEKEKILDSTDPVCGLKVNPANAKFSTKHGDEAYYFCSAECMGKFEQDAHKYVSNGDYLLDE